MASQEEEQGSPVRGCRDHWETLGWKKRAEDLYVDFMFFFFFFFDFMFFMTLSQPFY